MEGAPSEELASETLYSAREGLAAVLPPQADKILRALQHVDIALQYSSIEGRGDDALEATRNALKTLNLIERPRELPPAIGVAVTRAISELTRIVKAARMRNRSAATMPRKEALQENGFTGPDRRTTRNGGPEYFGPRRRSEDTIDALARFDEDLLQVL